MDKDCDGYYFRADACEPPVVLPKTAVTKAFEKKLTVLQGEVRGACVKQFQDRPACSAQPFAAVCAQRKCRDKLRTGDYLPPAR